MKNNTTIRQVFLLLVLALFLRIFNFSFPAFTSDEARIAYRGYTLYKNGVDELGRKFPSLFNSLNDYQLPLVFYISALGTGIFGKSEVGARIPFIIIGLILVLLTYKVSTELSKEKSFHIFSTFIVVTSPVLIFISKVPNESIVITTLFLLLFYLLNKDRLSLILILLIIILLIFTSKFSWFILTPFVIYTAFIYRKSLNKQDKLKLSLIVFSFTILAFVFFLKVPQGVRSLSENNLSLFSDITTKNGINRIRGQGIQSGWPPILGQILINKSHFFLVGILHWLSNIQPAVFFSQFSEDGNLGLIGMGAFPKVTIIPALMGLIFLIKEKKGKLLLYPLILTLPTALIYPQYSPQIVILTLPFVAYVIAFGLLQTKRIIGSLIFIFMILDLLINFFFLSPQIKLTDELRPDWIKPIVLDAFMLSNTNQVLISDNFVQDPASFIQWYAPFISQTTLLSSKDTYKFRQTNLGNIKLVGFSDSFNGCDKGKKSKLFLSKRDLDRVKKIGSGKVAHTYFNTKGLAVVYFMEDGACLN